MATGWGGPAGDGVPESAGVVKTICFSLNPTHSRTKSATSSQAMETPALPRSTDSANPSS